MKTTKEIIEYVDPEMTAFYDKFMALFESGEITGVFYTYQASDGGVVTFARSHTEETLIGLLEIAKHKFLSERRERYLRRQAESAAAPSTGEGK